MDQAPDPVVNPGSVTPPPAAAPLSTEPKKSVAYGSILGIILIVAVLVVGAFYVWGERLKMNGPSEENMGGGVLPDGTIPTTEGSASVRSGENGPEPI